jgi:regulator of RNase E activity RraA
LSDHDLDPSLRDLLATVSTNTISALLMHDVHMWTRTVNGVTPVSPAHCRFVGPAFTVRCVPIREDLERSASMANPGSPLHGTIDTIPAGSVVVYDMGGETRCGAMGDVMISVMKARGIAGVVADGAMRDGAAIAEIGLPVYCAGIAPPPIGHSLYTAGVQEVIGCGGVMVHPGDIVVGDPDGVVVIPREHVAEVAKKGAEKEAVEAWIRSRTDKGAPATGLYPPDEKVVAEFKRWRDAGGKL